MKNLEINTNNLLLTGEDSLILQGRVNTLFNGEAIIFPLETPKVLQKILRIERDDCTNWDCWFVSPNCTCEGNCDGCSGKQSGSN